MSGRGCGSEAGYGPGTVKIDSLGLLQEAKRWCWTNGCKAQNHSTFP